MGLDNGICLKTKNPLYVPHLIEDQMSEISPGNTIFDLCYWRKCYNIRSMIFDILGCDENDSGNYNLSYDNIVEITNRLIQMNRESKWDNSESIWTYDEIKLTLERNICVLAWAAQFMKTTTEEYQIYFYDSY